MAKAIGARSYETQLLADRLKNLKPAEVVSYHELATIAGMDVRPGGKGYQRLDRARHIVETESLFLIGTVAGVGVKRLEPDEQAAISDNSIGAVKRLARRRAKKLSIVEYGRLNPTQQNKHNMAASVLGVVQLFTRPKALEKLSGAVHEANGKLPVGNTLSLFQNGNGK
jgi:hypothetical protein